MPGQAQRGPASLGARSGDSVLVSAWPSLVLERRQDPGGELGGTASVDELEQRVQVVAAVPCERVRQLKAAAGLEKTVDPPGRDWVQISGGIRLSLRRPH